MSLEGNYINTRLETKMKYDSSNNLMDERYKLTNEIIKPSNDTIINFEGFNNNLNESRSKLSKDLEKEFNEKKNLYNKLDIKGDNKESIDNKNLDRQYIISEMNTSNDTLTIINNKNQDNKNQNNKNQDNKNQDNNILKKNIDLQIDYLENTNDKILNSDKDTVTRAYRSFSKDMLTKVVNILKRYNLETNYNELENYFLRYNINSNTSREIFDQMINDIRNQKKKIESKNYSIDYKEFSEYMYIDSSERNKEKFPSSSNFSMNIKKNNIFSNVKSIQLISAVISKNLNSEYNIEDFPYLVLEINQLGQNYVSNTDVINNAFALLNFEIDLGKYKKTVIKSEWENKKDYCPTISLDKLNINLKLPNGKLIEFNEENDDISKIVLLFKVNYLVYE